MAIGRSRYAPPYMSSTKGHSVLKQRSYAMPARKYAAMDTPVVSRASSAAYDTRAEEHFLSDRVNNVNYLSNTLMDEGYDTALRSRGRDQQLLKEATNAIVSSESYATPQTSVASRRVARGQSVAQRAASVPPRPLRPEVQVPAMAPAPASPPVKRPIVVHPGPRRNDRATSVPPVVVFREERALPVSVATDRRSKPASRPMAPTPPPFVCRGPYAGPVSMVPAGGEPLPTADLRAHKVPRRFLTRTAMRTSFPSLHGYYEEPGKTDEMRKAVTRARVLNAPVSRSEGRVSPYVLPQPKPAPIKESLSDFPKVYVPTKGQRPSNRSKAAIIASKLEPDPVKRRRPRSEYAANKYRELRREAMESGSGGGSHGGGQSGSSRT